MNLSYAVCVPPMLGVSFTDSLVCVDIVESAPLIQEKGLRTRYRLRQGLIIEAMREQLPQNPWGMGLCWLQVPPFFDPCVLSTEMLPWW